MNDNTIRTHKSLISYSRLLKGLDLCWQILFIVNKQKNLWTCLERANLIG